MSELKVNYLSGKMLPRIEGSRFLIIQDHALVERALPILYEHIKSIYKPVEFNVYEMKDGKFAIASADKDFYMGIQENGLLFQQTPPIPNALADIEKKKLSLVGVGRYTIGIRPPSAWTRFVDMVEEITGFELS